MSGVTGRTKGSSPVWRALIGDVGREWTGVEDDEADDEGVAGNGIEDEGKGLFTGERNRLGRDVGVSNRDLALADVGVAGVFVAGNRGNAAKGILGTGDGVGDDAREDSRSFTRSLV